MKFVRCIFLNQIDQSEWTSSMIRSNLMDERVRKVSSVSYARWTQDCCNGTTWKIARGCDPLLQSLNWKWEWNIDSTSQGPLVITIEPHARKTSSDFFLTFPPRLTSLLVDKRAEVSRIRSREIWVCKSDSGCCVCVCGCVCVCAWLYLEKQKVHALSLSKIYFLIFFLT